MYLWDLDHGFAGVILIKKAGDGSMKIKGCWDSIHVVEVQVSVRIEYNLQRKRRGDYFLSEIVLTDGIFNSFVPFNNIEFN